MNAGNKAGLNLELEGGGRFYFVSVTSAWVYHHVTTKHLTTCSLSRFPLVVPHRTSLQSN